MAISWTFGRVDPETGDVSETKVWLGSSKMNPESGRVELYILDGSDGKIEAAIPLILDDAPKGDREKNFGISDGAIDSEQAFWVLSREGSYLARGDFETHEAEVFPVHHSASSIAIGWRGEVFTCGAEIGRFDYSTQTWEVLSELDGSELQSLSASTGCIIDTKGILWQAAILADGSPGIAGFYIGTLRQVRGIETPTAVRGLAADFDGFLWGVTRGSEAYRIDVEAITTKTFSGLNGASSISDMTGMALFSQLPPLD